MILNAIFIGFISAIAISFGILALYIVGELIHNIAKRGYHEKNTDKWINWQKYADSSEITKRLFKGVAGIVLAGIAVFLVAPTTNLDFMNTSNSLSTAIFIVTIVALPFGFGIREAFSQADLNKRLKNKSSK